MRSINENKKTSFFVVPTNFPRFPIWKKFSFITCHHQFDWHDMTWLISESQLAILIVLQASTRATQAMLIVVNISTAFFSSVRASCTGSKNCTNTGLPRMHTLFESKNKYIALTPADLTTRQHCLVLNCLSVFLFQGWLEIQSSFSLSLWLEIQSSFSLWPEILSISELGSMFSSIRLVKIMTYVYFWIRVII